MTGYHLLALYDGGRYQSAEMWASAPLEPRALAALLKLKSGDLLASLRRELGPNFDLRKVSWSFGRILL